MILIYILVSVAAVFAVGVIGLLFLCLRAPDKNEEGEIRGATNVELMHMDNEKLILLALCQLLEVQINDWDLADELRYRATGKRKSIEKEGTTP